MSPTNDISVSVTTDQTELRKVHMPPRTSSNSSATNGARAHQTFSYDRAAKQSQPATALHVQVAALFVAWWAFNSAYAVNTDRLFRAHPFNVYAIDITLGQTLFTITIVLIYACVDHFFRASFPSKGPSNARSLLQQIPHLGLLLMKSPALVVASFAQVASALLTALSYATVGAAPTIVWKFAEPLTTVLVKWLILRSIPMSSTSKVSSRLSAGRTSPSAIIAILAILSGCLIFSWTSDVSIPQLLPVLLSNLLTPLRNTCFKRHQLRHYLLHTSSLPSSAAAASPRPSKHFNEDNAMVSFIALTLATAPFIPLLVILRIIFHNYFFVPPALTQSDLDLFSPSWAAIMLNSMLYACCQSASVYLLSLIDPVTHAVLNAFKRLAALVVASVMLHFHELSIRHAVAAVLSMAGFTAYALAKRRETTLTHTAQGNQNHNFIRLMKNEPQKSDMLQLRRHTQLKAAFAVFVAIFVIVTLFGKTKTRLVIPIAHLSSHHPESKRHHAPFWSNAIHVQVMPYRSENFSVNSYADLENVPGNLGDLLWKYAANERLVSFPKNRTVSCPIDVVSPWTCIHSVVNPSASQPVVLHAPMANYLTDNFGHILHVLAIYAQHPLVTRILITGIGVQEVFPSRRIGSEELVSEKSVRDAARAYEISASVRADIAALSDSTRVTFLARGEVTRLVLRKLGVLDARVLGCPSIWANEHTHLGDKLFTRYEELSKRENDFSLRVAIPIKSFPRYYWVHKTLANLYPNATFIAQTSHDLVKLSNMDIPFTRVKIYKDARDWVTDMKNYDVVFGGRMHGILAGVLATTPVVAIAVDWRMAELCEALRIPFVSPYDALFEQKVNMDIASIVRLYFVPFDAPAFDRNRCRMARIVTDTFESVGMTVRDHIHKIAQMC